MQPATIPFSQPAVSAAPQSLEEEINKLRREIRPEGYSMSVGEIASLYEEGEMDIQPRFQRFFRWTKEQKTALVESILLGIPLPQIFVSAREDQVWEVVDGLQRLSTIFQFMGKLRDKGGKKVEPLKLGRASHLRFLEGCEWETLPDPVRRIFRRAKLSVSILGAESTPVAKYDLFERLNTGGARLSPQEVRNCILVMENEEFHERLENLSRDRNFRECVAVSERLEREQYHMELASRLLIFADIPAGEIKGDIGRFVTRKMVEMAKSAGADEENFVALERMFRDTFIVLASLGVGGDVFRRYHPKDGKFKGAFASSPYEAVACGIAHHLRGGKSAGDFQSDDILEKIQRMGEDDDFWKRSTGRSTADRLGMTIPYGREHFRP